MGIKGFYSKFKTRFPSVIKKHHPIEFENHLLILEINGLFYEMIESYYARKVIEKTKSFILCEFLEVITSELSTLVDDYSFFKTIFIIVDGLSPMMKIKEMRKRRYLNSIENKYDNFFDLNQFTPGSKTFSILTNHIYRCLQQLQSNKEGSIGSNILFSSEQEKGEGELKALSYIKSCQEPLDIMILSMDSDWIPISILPSIHRFLIKKPFKKILIIFWSIY